MANKFRVSQEHDGKIFVYGNFRAANAEEAIQKAYDKQQAYYPFDMTKAFQVKNGSVEQDVILNG